VPGPCLHFTDLLVGIHIIYVMYCSLSSAYDLVIRMTPSRDQGASVLESEMGGYC
jgi:hypothetical protein